MGNIDLNGNISGAGQDPIGQFSIVGTDSGATLSDSSDSRSSDSEGNSHEKSYEINFVKQYAGAHAVVYMGHFDGKKITGKWEIPDNCNGKFQIKCNLPKWKGFSKEDGEKNDMEMYLKFRPGHVWGFGQDEESRFYIRGYLDPNHGLISFVKSYVYRGDGGESRMLHYNGSMINGGYIKGTWVQPGKKAEDNHGKFKLKNK